MTLIQKLIIEAYFQWLIDEANNEHDTGYREDMYGNPIFETEEEQEEYAAEMEAEEERQRQEMGITDYER